MLVQYDSEFKATLQVKTLMFFCLPVYYLKLNYKKNVGHIKYFN